VTRTGKPTITIDKLHAPEVLSPIIQKVCHDIGNPLTSIISLASLLDGGMAPVKPERLPTYSRAIVDESWRVARLSERLSLLFASTKPVTEPSSLRSLVLKAIHRYHTRHAKGEPLRALEEQLQNDTSPSPTVVGDGEQLTLLLMELLENGALAVEAMPESPLTLSLMQGTDHAQVVITNHASTPYDGELSRLFDPLTRGAAEGRSLGLGLTIAAITAERLGGAIWIEEEVLNTTVNPPSASLPEAQSAAGHPVRFSLHLKLPSTLSPTGED
jgi:signal transduction histidine kinase